MNTVTQQTVFAHLRNRGLQAADGQGVFGPAVDITVRGAQGEGGDEHALQHRVRIAF